ncbi:unnamed protein product [Amoebophrya sp. A25]|nr:unnamed protein product [Amoebophrya sp. A25]|eukprot:GSA25T00020514001.1
MDDSISIISWRLVGRRGRKGVRFYRVRWVPSDVVSLSGAAVGAALLSSSTSSMAVQGQVTHEVTHYGATDIQEDEDTAPGTPHPAPGTRHPAPGPVTTSTDAPVSFVEEQVKPWWKSTADLKQELASFGEQQHASNGKMEKAITEVKEELVLFRQQQGVFNGKMLKLMQKSERAPVVVRVVEHKQEELHIMADKVAFLGFNDDADAKILRTKLQGGVLTEATVHCGPASANPRKCGINFEQPFGFSSRVPDDRYSQLLLLLKDPLSWANQLKLLEAHWEVIERSLCPQGERDELTGPISSLTLKDTSESTISFGSGFDGVRNMIVELTKISERLKPFGATVTVECGSSGSALRSAELQLEFSNEDNISVLVEDTARDVEEGSSEFDLGQQKLNLRFFDLTENELPGPFFVGALDQHAAERTRDLILQFGQRAPPRLVTVLEGSGQSTVFIIRLAQPPLLNENDPLSMGKQLDFIEKNSGAFLRELCVYGRTDSAIIFEESTYHYSSAALTNSLPFQKVAAELKSVIENGASEEKELTVECTFMEKVEFRVKDVEIKMKFEVQFDTGAAIESSSPLQAEQSVSEEGTMSEGSAETDNSIS